MQTPETMPGFAVTSPEDSHCSAVTAVACCGDYVCSAGGDAAIRVYKATTLEFVKCVPQIDIVTPRTLIRPMCYLRITQRPCAMDCVGVQHHRRRLELTVLCAGF